MKLATIALLVILPCVAAAQESPAELLATAKTQYDARKYKDALATFEKARATAEAAGDAINVAHAKLGIAALKTMHGAFDEGIALSNEAYATFDAAGDPRGRAAALQKLGNLHIGAAKFAAAADYFRRCAAITDGGRVASCLEQLGQCEESLGQYRQSMATLREAMEAAIAAHDKKVQAGVVAGMGDVYRNQGNAELAAHYDQKAIAMYRELDDKPNTSKTLNNLGISYNMMGRSDLALGVYRENLAIMERLKYARGINVSKMNIAATLIKTGRHEEAAPILNELLPEFERLNDPNSRANVLRLLTMVDDRRGDYSAALAHALAAAAQRTDQINDVYLAHAQLGYVYRRLGKFAEARESLTRAIDVIESMHGHSTSGQVHFFFEGRSDAYTEMAALAIEEGRVEEAFEHAERYRTRVLMDVLRSAPGDRSHALNEEERKRERELAESLAALQKKALHDASAELNDAIAAARRDYDAFQLELADAHPRLHVERGTLPPIAARDIASRLPREAILVEWLVTADKTYAFVISGGTIEVRAIDVTRNDLARDAESFRALLANRRPDFRKSARALHRTLLAPLADLLSKRRSWILIPDGPLWNLPFQALLDSRGSYVAEQAAIVYAPSVAAWMEMSRSPIAAAPDARRDLLAFGNPTIPAAAGVEGSRNTLAPLPEAETEVKSAARFYGAGSAVYVRDEATEERFKAEASRYRVLHVAGHGVLNDTSPMHSYLLLAAGKGNEDGYLEAGELMQMDLGAELVVLSACDTARGKYAAGEGIIGFSWALFAARCKTQVVSQWKVDSAATSVLMRNFHKNVRTDRTRAASALQKTIVAMLKTKEYRHPFYWAGFVVSGDAL